MKHTLSDYIEPTAERLAREMGLTLVDVELVKENTGRFLRFYIDTPAGVDLNALESFHRRVQPLMDNVEYDYMEVCSPGADRPLKKSADFERAAGQTVEVRLYRAQNGLKRFTGELRGLIDGCVVVNVNGQALSFPQKSVARVSPVVEWDEDAEDVDVVEAEAEFDAEQPSD